MEVEWRDLTVTIGSKQILAPCSGHLRPGRMTALMGPSGCGKSTLLNCLRQTTPHAGEVRFDGSHFCQDLRQLIGFTEQDDVVIPQLTVRQSLQFLADLRFGIGSKDAVHHVEQALITMRLSHIADSVIGEAGRSPRISGGERRRLCIARELLAEPRLLLCDEPTSGLDSTMADQVVASMRELSDEGCVSVIAAIHQPSSNIFGRFDDLLLVCQGQLLYSGPASEAEAFFTSHGVPRDPSQSTAEYLMDLLVLGADDQKSCLMSPETRGELVRCVQDKAASLPPLDPPSKAKMVDRRYAAPVGRQLAVLLSRHGTLMLKDIFTKFAAIQNMGLMLVAALLWVQLGFTEHDVFPRWGIALWILGTWMFFPMFGALGTFASFHRVLEKELSVGCYSLESFYVARTLMLLPVEFIWPTIWTTGVYWISNANPHLGVFLSVLCLVFLSFSTFQGIGLAVSASAMSPQAANTLLMIMITFFFAWTGFFVDLSHLPAWIVWVRHLNPFRYAVQLMVQTIVTDDLEFVCGGPSGGMGVQDASVGCERTSTGAVILTGARARARHKIETSPWICLAVLVVTLLAFRILAFLLLRRDFWTAVHGAKESRLSPSLPEPAAGLDCSSIAVDVPEAEGAEKLRDQGHAGRCCLLRRLAL